ncbi:MAG: leucyl/phenylalanyl-tRNA--protein transferase, partial [Chromatiales bacterium]|nr:leucyl/phenylalanyl-tRNA--protein transferase [Chromatiales bacterium]
TQLFEQGHAHSVEVWEDDHLVGGLYGVAVGRLFCGESMFTRAPDASKIALVTLACHLAHWGFPLIDSQTSTPHMLHLGAELIPRALYRELLDDLCQLPGLPGPWRVDPDLDVIEWKPGATSSPT